MGTQKQLNIACVNDRLMKAHIRVAEHETQCYIWSNHTRWRTIIHTYMKAKSLLLSATFDAPSGKNTDLDLESNSLTPEQS